MKKNIEVLEQLHSLSAHMTSQLVGGDISWNECLSSAETGLRLVEEECRNPRNANNTNFLDDLKEKFTGILKYVPGKEDLSKEEDMQYQRYHMILALDSIKRLIDHFTSTDS